MWPEYSDEQRRGGHESKGQWSKFDNCPNYRGDTQSGKEKVKAIIKRRDNVITWLLFLIIFVNVSLIFLYLVNFLETKRIRRYGERSVSYASTSKTSRADQFDAQIPDLRFHTDQGQSFELSNLAGDVIVIRYYQSRVLEAPQLIYLDHLYEKFKAYGLRMFFVWVGKDYDYLWPSLLQFSVPLVQEVKDISS
jgi:hypothetical protein